MNKKSRNEIKLILNKLPWRICWQHIHAWKANICVEQYVYSVFVRCTLLY